MGCIFQYLEQTDCFLAIVPYAKTSFWKHSFAKAAKLWGKLQKRSQITRKAAWVRGAPKRPFNNEYILFFKGWSSRAQLFLPANLPLPFTNTPIKDTAPGITPRPKWIVYPIGIIHPPNFYPPIPIGIRRAIMIQVSHHRSR